MKNRDLVARDADIVSAVTDQQRTLADVAMEYGLTTERVRQIVARDRPDFAVRSTRTTLTRERRARAREEHEQNMQRWRESVDHPGNRRGFVRRWTKEDLLRILREQTEIAGRPLSTLDWKQISRDRGLPSVSLYMVRFSSWNEAKRLAGLDPLPSSRLSYTRSFTDEEMIAAVARFLRDAERGRRRFGSHHYAEWRDSRADFDNLPSLPLLWQRLGKWSVVKEAAIAYNKEHHNG